VRAKRILAILMVTLGAAGLGYQWWMRHPSGDRAGVRGAGNAIHRGKAYLLACQEDDGSFLLTRKDGVLGDARQCRTTGYVGLVLYELLWLRDDAAVASMCDRAADYLMKASNADGLYSFYPDSPDEPPPDVDDTGMSLLALLALGRNVSRETLARVHGNRVAGGGYRTWFVAMEVEDNPAPIVSLNAELCEFLGGSYGGNCGYRNEYVLRWLADGIGKGRGLKAEWYRSEHYMIYVLSRNYAAGLRYLGEYREQLVNWLVRSQKDDGSWVDSVTGRSSALSTAFAVLALRNLAGVRHKPQVRKACEFLVGCQNADGSWPAEFCFRQGAWSDRIVFGGRALSTAAAMRAIHSAVQMLE